MAGVNGMVVLGLKDVQEKMRKLPRAMGKTLARRALYDGAKVMGEDARRRVKVRTGALKKSIYWYTDTSKKKPDEIKVAVSVRKQSFNVGQTKSGKSRIKKSKKGERGAINPRLYAHLVEFGTKPHTIRAKKGGALATPAGPRSVVSHPGSTANPFMRPAFQERKGDAVKAVATRIRAEIELEMGKKK